MTDEQGRKDWWVTVHGAKHGLYPDHGRAFAAARAAKRANPHLHVAVMDSQGVSTLVDGYIGAV